MAAQVTLKTANWPKIPHISPKLRWFGLAGADADSDGHAVGGHAAGKHVIKYMRKLNPVKSSKLKPRVFASLKNCTAESNSKHRRPSNRLHQECEGGYLISQRGSQEVLEQRRKHAPSFCLHFHNGLDVHFPTGSTYLLQRFTAPAKRIPGGELVRELRETQDILHVSVAHHHDRVSMFETNPAYHRVNHYEPPGKTPNADHARKTTSQTNQERRQRPTANRQAKQTSNKDEGRKSEDLLEELVVDDDRRQRWHPLRPSLPWPWHLPPRPPARCLFVGRRRGGHCFRSGGEHAARRPRVQLRRPPLKHAPGCARTQPNR
eukprot:1930966-Rhodomonas_salina.4